MPEASVNPSEASQEQATSGQEQHRVEPNFSHTPMLRELDELGIGEVDKKVAKKLEKLIKADTGEGVVKKEDFDAVLEFLDDYQEELKDRQAEKAEKGEKIGGQLERKIDVVLESIYGNQKAAIEGLKDAMEAVASGRELDREAIDKGLEVLNFIKIDMVRFTDERTPFVGPGGMSEFEKRSREEINRLLLVVLDDLIAEVPDFVKTKNENILDLDRIDEWKEELVKWQERVNNVTTQSAVETQSPTSPDDGEGGAGETGESGEDESGAEQQTAAVEREGFSLEAMKLDELPGYDLVVNARNDYLVALASRLKFFKRTTSEELENLRRDYQDVLDNFLRENALGAVGDLTGEERMQKLSEFLGKATVEELFRFQDAESEIRNDSKTARIRNFFKKHPFLIAAASTAIYATTAVGAAAISSTGNVWAAIPLMTIGATAATALSGIVAEGAIDYLQGNSGRKQGKLRRQLSKQQIEGLSEEEINTRLGAILSRAARRGDEVGWTQEGALSKELLDRMEANLTKEILEALQGGASEDQVRANLLINEKYETTIKEFESFHDKERKATIKRWVGAGALGLFTGSFASSTFVLSALKYADVANKPREKAERKVDYSEELNSTEFDMRAEEGEGPRDMFKRAFQDYLSRNWILLTDRQINGATKWFFETAIKSEGISYKGHKNTASPDARLLISEHASRFISNDGEGGIYNISKNIGFLDAIKAVGGEMDKER